MEYGIVLASYGNSAKFRRMPCIFAYEILYMLYFMFLSSFPPEFKKCKFDRKILPSGKQKPGLLLFVSTSQGPELHLDVSAQQEP
jgi:hypothetical protein